MNNKNLVIRNATVNDITKVAKLHIDSWNKTYKGIIDQDYLDTMKNNLDKRTQRMKNEFNLRKMIVATIDDEIVAFSEFTLTNEDLMYNGICLQDGTSHYFGQKFSKAYVIV